MEDQSTFVKNFHASGGTGGCCGVNKSVNEQLGGNRLARVLQLDPKTNPLCIVPYEENGVTVTNASGEALALLAIMPSKQDKGFCSSLALLIAAKIPLPKYMKKKVNDPKSSVTMNTAAAVYLHDCLIRWGLKRHPKTSSTHKSGWEHTMRLYTLPASAVGSGQATVYGSFADAKKVRKMISKM